MQNMNVATAEDQDDDYEFPIQLPAKTPRKCRSTVLILAAFGALVALYFIVGFAQSEREAVRGSKDNSNADKSPESSSSTTPLEEDEVGGDPTKWCLAGYQCQSEHPDRMSHATPMLYGHALCNDNIRFGISFDGIFQWQNCDTFETKVIFENATEIVSYFQMTPSGSFQLLDSSDKVIWEVEPKMTISYTKSCLSNPKLDCPYL